MIVGCVVSTTPTAWVAVVVLVLASVAVQVTAVWPRAKTPGALLVTPGAASHTSLTPGSPSDGDAPCGEVHSTLARFVGAVRAGCVVSCTVTLAVQSYLLSSTACYIPLRRLRIRFLSLSGTCCVFF